jgi:hypothetical protein
MKSVTKPSSKGNVGEKTAKDKRDIAKGAEDAKILSETKNDKQPPASQPLHSEEVSVDEKDSIKAAKVGVDFMCEEYTNDLIDKDTKIVDEPTKTKDIGSITSEDIKKEEKESPPLTLADFELFAGFIMEIIDMLASTGLKAFAKDTSHTAYSLPKDRMNSLTRQLAMILLKYQARMRIELIFLFTLAAAYYGPFIKAKENRKKIMGGVEFLPDEDNGKAGKKRGVGRPEK